MNVLGINSLFDVFGLGHTLVDVSVKVTQDQLDSLGLRKGEQKFVGDPEVQRALQKIPDDRKMPGIGGNVRNTLQGLALFGDKTCYCSKIGPDDHGALVRANLKTHHIADRLCVNQSKTGTCLVLVSEDGDRSMITFGGDDDVETIVDKTFIRDIDQSRILYTSGYMLNHPQRLKIFEDSVDLACRSGTIIALDLGDPKVVSVHRERIQELMRRRAIQILFGNADELTELFGDDFESSLSIMQRAVPIVVAKLGAKGAIVVTRHGCYDIPANSKEVVDTTGAGDMFAAGFLHGLLHEYPIDVCGYLGALVAGDAIGHSGVKLSEDIQEKLRALLELHGVPKKSKVSNRADWLYNIKAEYLKDKPRMKQRRPMQIQVCGIRSFEEARMLLASGVDRVAFPLHLPVHKEDVSADAAAEIVHRLRDPDRCVLITYLEKAEDIIDLARKLGIKNIQLHGDTTVDEIKRIKEKDREYFIVKSLIVKPDGNQDELTKIIADYSDYVDAFIIDTYDPETGATGATGKIQNWNVSRELVKLSSKPVILAGGLNSGNVYDAILIVRPFGITVHTGVESIDGNKDADLVNKFLEEARRGFKRGPQV